MESVTSSEGYKEAYEHFEEIINALIRAKEVNYDYLRGVEDVFRYFETGKSVAENAEKQIEEYKDVE